MGPKGNGTYELGFLFTVALHLAEVSTNLCKEFAAQRVNAKRKADKTWVTDADLAIERKLRLEISKLTPGVRVLGEEEGGQPLDATCDARFCPENIPADELCWILDPIDGTFSFVHGIPFYSSLVALCHGTKSIVGVASLPGMDVQMSAYKGGGCYLNGEKIHKTPAQLMQSAPIELLATADHYRFRMEGKDNVLHSLLAEPFKTRTYPDALGYYMLLGGHIRAFVDPKVEVWDVAPFYCILPEAGCEIHSWNGVTGNLQRGTSVAYALNDTGLPLLCDDVLKILRG